MPALMSGRCSLLSKEQLMSDHQFRSWFASLSLQLVRVPPGRFCKARMFLTTTWRNCSKTGNRWNTPDRLKKLLSSKDSVNCGNSTKPEQLPKNLINFGDFFTRQMRQWSRNWIILANQF